MADVAQVEAVSRAIEQLRVRVGEARAAYGDSTAIQRLINDVDRLCIDVRDLEPVAVKAPPRAAPPHPSMPRITIDDSQPDPAMFADADDEGIGGFHGPHGTVHR